MEEKIVIVLNEMSEYLSIAQMKKLQEVIIKTFAVCPSEIYEYHSGRRILQWR